jgi:hypothetical protein
MVSRDGTAVGMLCLVYREKKSVNEAMIQVISLLDHWIQV